MDYIEYALNKYYEQIEIEDEMARLGIDNYDDYVSYLEDEKAYLQEMQMEAMKEAQI